MKKLFVLPVATIVALGACSDVVSVAGPEGPNFQLVDPSLRLETGNADVIATFSYTIPGDPGFRAGEPGVNSEGREIGWCAEDGSGKWQNPSNKKWANAVPHAHCMNEGADEKRITLEKITSQYVSVERGAGANVFTVTDLFFSNRTDTLSVRWHGQSTQMTGVGEVHARAVDQYGSVHGHFVFDLSDLSGKTNYFAEYEATVEGAGVCVFGLSETITATYSAPGDNVGKPVPGTLYWETGSSCASE
jgi:hypothetical protein